MTVGIFSFNVPFQISHLLIDSFYFVSITHRLQVAGQLALSKRESPVLGIRQEKRVVVFQIYHADSALLLLMPPVKRE